MTSGHARGDLGNTPAEHCRVSSLCVAALTEFSPPWTTEETEASFIVKDRNGQKLV